MNLSHSSFVGNDNFYTNDFDKTPNSVKYQTKSKHEKKLMVWVAASINGLSEIYVVPSRGTVNSDIYIKECLKMNIMSNLWQKMKTPLTSLTYRKVSVYVESGSEQGLGLLTTLVVATCRCRKMSSDITAFDMSKCRATFSKMSIKMSMSKMSKYLSVQNSNI